MRSPEEVKRELVRKWMAKGEEDFGVAEHLLSENTPYLTVVGFHSQQAAEKFLKAFLVWRQIDFPKTHDLDELLDLIATVSDSLAYSLRDVIILTKYGVDIRYPGDFPDMTTEDAKKAVELARKVCEAVRKELKSVGIS